MKKMPCLFVRTFHDKRSFTITETVTPGCEWVLDGEGTASRKWDGTACMIRNGLLFKRYDAKKDPKTGEYKMPPEGAIACSKPDPETGHWPHWVEVPFYRSSGSMRLKTMDSQAKYIVEALQETKTVAYRTSIPGAQWRETTVNLPNGETERLCAVLQEPDEQTYEACGPKINSNHEGLGMHFLFKHGGSQAEMYIGSKPVRTFDSIKHFLTVNLWEGLVFAHPDGRFAKIRRADFGLAWPAEKGGVTT